MAGKQHPDQSAQGAPSEGDKHGKNQGEGNREAAREYNTHTTEFATDSKRVQDAADRAKQAVEGKDGDKLRQAEKEGLTKARH